MVLLEVAGIEVSVVRKDVRNLHLSVLPPDGRVRITAPAWIDDEAIRLFVVEKLGWIKRQRSRMHQQEREAPRQYVDRESHQVWGQRYLLRIIEQDASPQVEINHQRLLMKVRPGMDATSREALLYAWYRRELRREAAALLDHWVPRVGVHPRAIHVQRMRTRWGSCNPEKGSIRLNTELAKKPPESLEYILVHELVHLVERTHGPGFVERMNRLLPAWRDRQGALNRLPIR